MKYRRWFMAYQFFSQGRHILLVLVLGSMASALFGCDKPASTANSAATISSNAPPPPGFALTNAQPKLKTTKLWLGSQELTVELAATLPQVMTGMMFRKQMAENEGMLFIFGLDNRLPGPHRASFYMRNTLIPLSCAYMDSEGMILEIHDMKPLDESPIEAKSDNVQYVLEVNQGWFERNKVSPGAVARTEFGSLPDTFFKGR